MGIGNMPAVCRALYPTVVGEAGERIAESLVAYAKLRAQVGSRQGAGSGEDIDDGLIQSKRVTGTGLSDVLRGRGGRELEVDVVVAGQHEGEWVRCGRAAVFDGEQELTALAAQVE